MQSAAEVTLTERRSDRDVYTMAPSVLRLLKDVVLHADYPPNVVRHLVFQSQDSFDENRHFFQRQVSILVRLKAQNLFFDILLRSRAIRSFDLYMVVNLSAFLL